jgi:hypothetical protein
MKIICLGLFCALLAGCNSMGTAKTGSVPTPAAASAQPTNQYHARTISEFSEGESKFLDMAPSTNP